MQQHPGSTVDVRDLRRSFAGHEALAGVSFSVEPGTLMALLGPNGSGKTTTVRILSTLLHPSAGTATVGGFDVGRHPAQVRKILGLTAQQHTVDNVLTGRENLEMLGRLHRMGRRGARRRADELLERFDLTGAASRRAATYSGGMRRRLDLAASLVATPSVLFLDEPTTGLDPRSRQGLWDVIRDLLADGTTILLTTQYLEEADQLADEVAVLRDGRIVGAGSPTELKRRVGDERLVLEVMRWDEQRARDIVDITLPHMRAEDGITGAAPSASETDQRGTAEVMFALQGPDHLRQCLNALQAADIEVLNLDVRHSTLDDVFFSLTDQEVAA